MIEQYQFGLPPALESVLCRLQVVQQTSWEIGKRRSGRLISCCRLLTVRYFISCWNP